jgi:hypothetical protein
MAAPLVTALGYFLAPRLVGAAADRAMKARVEDLIQDSMMRGTSAEDVQARVASDPYLNALANLPRQSGVESTIASLRDLYNGNPYGVSRADIPPTGVDVSGSDARTIDQMLSGQGFDLGTPTQFYLDTNSRGGSEFITPMDDFLRYGGRDADTGVRFFGGYAPPSYGQTDQPATEVRFDQPPGGAHGGLAALIRGMHAKR